MKRRKFLKTMSIMAAAMYVDLPTFAQNVSQMGKEKLKVGILSDIHITDTESAKTFRHALEYFRDRHADGVIIAGDMADWGIESQLKIVADTWFEVFPKDRLPDGQHIERLFIYGNHDYEAYKYEEAKRHLSDKELLRQAIGPRQEKIWKKYFKEDYAPIYMKTVKGYHFIGAQWHSWTETPGLADFLSNNNAAIAGEKPFFYFQHAYPKGTCYGEWAWGQDNGDVTKALSKYANCIAFSGHSHMPLNNEYDLWQGKFISIGTASLSYQYPLGARENAEIDGSNEKVPSQMKVLNCGDGKQGMLMTVYDKYITFECREFVYDQAVADNWIIPLPLQAEQMSFKNRAKNAVAPEFDKKDKVSIRHIENGEDRYGVRLQQIEVSFPSVLKKRTGVRATDYEVWVEKAFLDTITITHTKRVYSNGFYLGEAQDEKDVTCLFGKHELPKNRKWRFAVLPCESFGKKGAAIYSEWQEPIKQ